MKSYKKLLSIILSLVMILMVSESTYANNTKIVVAQTHISNKDGVYIVDPEDVIDALSVEELENQNCIERVSDLEDDMYSVVYKCADGNYAAYFFQYPVKYIDAVGEVKDISTLIKRSESTAMSGNGHNSSLSQLKKEYSFASTENIIKIFYSEMNLTFSSRKYTVFVPSSLRKT